MNKNTSQKTAFSSIRDPNSPMPSKYDSKVVEQNIYDWWNKNGYFEINSNFDPNAEKMIMLIPPPNVTGNLHLGHGLTSAVEDTIIRWSRMTGRKTLWVPGTDHAGIATQNVVERKLLREKKLSRHDMTRKEFINEVWKWKNEYGSTIMEQIKRLGASVDWSRQFFTLDEKCSKAVTTAFVRLYKKKKIYRAKRFVNWSSALSTAIADCEVDKTEVPKRMLFSVPGHPRKVEFGVIHKFSYKLVDSEEEIFIETTRPETILGDVAIAVHPKDERYKKFVGKFAKHPFFDRKVKIITDSVLVDMEKGTEQCAHLSFTAFSFIRLTAPFSIMSWLQRHMCIFQRNFSIYPFAEKNIFQKERLLTSVDSSR